jgi:hypothetical protein
MMVPPSQFVKAKKKKMIIVFPYCTDCPFSASSQFCNQLKIDDITVIISQ